MHNGEYITRYDFWDQSTWTIPKLYWDAFSQEQRIHALCRQLAKVIAYADYVGANTDNLIQMQKDLEAQFEKFMESGFEDYYAEQIEAWVNEHMQSIIEQAIKFVFFGLTDDGYFCAYIPKSWQGILFDTIADYANENYGCLVLSY